jgi:hypothetical protein
VPKPLASSGGNNECKRYHQTTSPEALFIMPKIMGFTSKSSQTRSIHLILNEQQILKTTY